MAQMYPKDISLIQHTESEEKVYRALESQLSNRISVFFSVSWISNVNNEKIQSECDFLIFDPMYGFLCCEVKGGLGIKNNDGTWVLIENRFSERKLNCSPIEQAEKSMHYFYNLYAKEFNYPFKGTYGAISIFPNFAIEDPEKTFNRPKNLILDIRNLNTLSEDIKKAFIFYKNKYRNNFVSEAQQKNFVGLIQKRIAIAAAAGALICDKERELSIINRVQDNYVYFLKNYSKALISGGAGTGKTWIAMKMAIKEEKAGKKVLITCYSEHLIKLFKSHLSKLNIDVYSIKELIRNDGCDPNLVENNSYALLEQYDKKNYKKYDAIIVDEAQDFDKNISLIIRYHLKNDDCNLYVFYDKTQNILNKDFEDGFFIDLPPFCLRENLRNTSNISKWSIEQTKLHSDVITNQIVGPQPERIIFSTFDEMRTKLEDVLYNLIEKEYVDKNFITVLCDDINFKKLFNNNISLWKLSNDKTKKSIDAYSVKDFKGLESNVVIYIHNKSTDKTYDYVAYTRAKFYLYDFIIKD